MNFIRTRLHQQSYEIGHSSVGHAQRRRMVSDFWSITCNERIEIISVCRHTGGRLTICAIKCWQCPKKKIDNSALKEHVRWKQITFQIKKLNTNTNTDTDKIQTRIQIQICIYKEAPPDHPPSWRTHFAKFDNFSCQQQRHLRIIPNQTITNTNRIKDMNARQPQSRG